MNPALPATVLSPCRLLTPLAPDLLLLAGCTAREGLSALGEAELTLRSERKDIAADALLGKPVGLAIDFGGEEQPRHLHGIVTRFTHGGFEGRHFVYRMTLRPWLWLLTRTVDCRVFQELSVPDIVKAVFQDHPVANCELRLFRSYRPWTYCVQYRESDFNFVARLLEHEGIYWWFEHEEGAHKLVLCDAASAHDAAPGCESLPFHAGGAPVAPGLEVVREWSASRGMKPGKVVITDYDFERPSASLLTDQARQRSYDLSDAEVFDYPGGYTQAADGAQLAEDRLDEIQSRFETFSGATNAQGVRAGCLLTLARHPREDQNAQYLVTATTLELDLPAHESGEGREARLECRFDAIPAAQQFRPPRRTVKPCVPGPQTAVVTGPAGEELFTDKHGRVKVQFPWDRRGQRNENSSCWVRVSQPWAGKGWGGVSIPRIGQEVVVDFLEGDPDLPLIIGRVYNAEQTPPFPLPEGAVVSGIKSKSHKATGYNELSMDDTAGKEKVTIHGQYDMGTTVEHDQTTTVHNCRTDTIDVDDSETVGNNQTQRVGVNQTITVGADRKKTVNGSETVAVVVNRLETVGCTETLTITGHRTETVNGGETVTITGGRSHTVNGVQQTTVTLAEVHSVGAGRMHNVGAAEAVTVGGAQMVNVGALQSVAVKGPHKLSAATIQQTSKGTFKVKAAGTAVIEAPTIVFKAGGSKIVLNSSGITIKGGKVLIKADGDATIKAGGSVKVKSTTIGEN